jgi:hypothetical protein
VEVEIGSEWHWKCFFDNGPSRERNIHEHMRHREKVTLLMLGYSSTGQKLCLAPSAHLKK